MSLESKNSLKPETSSALNQLIAANLDSSSELDTAAEKIDDARLGSLLRSIAATRRQQAQELQGFVTRSGFEAEDEGTLRGAFHEALLTFRAAVNGGKPKVVLIEAERGEDAIKETYEELIKATSGSAVNDVLHRHYAQVKRHHDLILDLRGAY